MEEAAVEVFAEKEAVGVEGAVVLENARDSSDVAGSAVTVSGESSVKEAVMAAEAAQLAGSATEAAVAEEVAGSELVADPKATGRAQVREARWSDEATGWAPTEGGGRAEEAAEDPAIASLAVP